MLVVAGFRFNSLSGQNFFYVEMVANLSLHDSKQLELGQDVLRCSNLDRIMT